MPDELPVTGTIGGSATPTPQPIPEAGSVTPAVEVADPKALQALVAQLEQRLFNKTQEADRLHKKVQAAEDAEKTEAQKLKDRAERAEQEAALLRQNIQRQDIAARVGLPAVFANRILGATPEEMEADAKAMLASLPKQPAPKVGPTNPTDGRPQTETDAQRKRRLGLR
jgi:hypothetical protein